MSSPSPEQTPPEPGPSPDPAPQPYTPPPPYGANPHQPAYPGYHHPPAFWVSPDDRLVVPPGAGINAWFARIVATIRRGWRPLLLIIVITQGVPVLLLGAAALAYTDLFRSSPLFGADAGTLPEAEAAAAARELFGDLIPFLGLVLVGVVVSSLLQAVGYAAATWSMVRRAAGEPDGLGDALRYGLRRMFGLWGWTLASGLLIAVGLCLCVLPGVYFAFALALVGPVYLFERRNPVGRSWQLTHAQLGPVLGRLAIVLAVVLVPSMVLNFAHSVIVGAFGAAGDPFSPVTMVFAVASLVIALPTAVIQTVALVVTYAEQRARETPWSTAHLAGSLGH